MVASAAPLIEPGSPAFLERFALRLQQTFLPLFPTSPVRLWPVLFADLPDATRWRGCIVYVTDKSKAGLSNGTAWTDTAGGAL